MPSWPPFVTQWGSTAAERARTYPCDLLDNFGRRSPRELTPGMERFEVGQRVMTIFHLVEFEPGRSLTVRSGGRFGDVVCTYLADPRGDGTSRIVLKILARYPGGLRCGTMRLLLAPGDLVMARRQLLNLKRLAERSHAARAGASAPAG
jgi:hypothetical protein